MSGTLKPDQRAFIGQALCASIFAEARSGSSRAETKERLVKTLEVGMKIRDELGEDDKRGALTDFSLDMFDVLWPDEEQD